MEQFHFSKETAVPDITTSAGISGASAKLKDMGDNTFAPVIAAATLGTEYETVAASQADQVMGATGAAGDLLLGLLVVPATTSPGAITIKDGAGGSAMTVFTGGASSVGWLVPFYIPLNLRSLNGGWRVTTGANVSVIGTGDFT